MRNFVRRKYIKPKEDESIEKAMSLIKIKVDNIKTESIAIIVFNVLVVILASQLISNEVYVKSIISLSFLVTLGYAIKSFVKHWRFLYDYFFIYRFNYKKFIFQMIYKEVYPEVDDTLKKLNFVEKMINKKAGKSKGELTLVITEGITNLLLKNLFQMSAFFLFFLLLYNFYLKGLLLETFTHMSFYEILFYILR